MSVMVVSQSPLRCAAGIGNILRGAIPESLNLPLLVRLIAATTIPTLVGRTPQGLTLRLMVPNSTPMPWKSKSPCPYLEQKSYHCCNVLKGFAGRVTLFPKRGVAVWQLAAPVKSLGPAPSPIDISLQTLAILCQSRHIASRT